MTLEGSPRPATPPSQPWTSTNLLFASGPPTNTPCWASPQSEAVTLWVLRSACCTWHNVSEVHSCRTAALFLFLRLDNSHSIFRISRILFIPSSAGGNRHERCHCRHPHTRVRVDVRAHVAGDGARQGMRSSAFDQLSSCWNRFSKAAEPFCVPGSSVRRSLFPRGLANANYWTL